MSRRLREEPKTLLLVCEGASSEPKYFESLAAKAKEAGLFDHVEIFPRPKDKDELRPRANTKGNARQRREFALASKHVSERTVEEADEDELPFCTRRGANETWALPVRYIKEARDRIKEAEYTEAWAIFDKDGHASPAAAFQLAAIPVLDRQINIAFSSISFEHWVLLHFEKNNTPFVRSECKESDVSISCGSGNHHSDCYGVTCVSGRIVGQGHLDTYDKSNAENLFDEIGGLTDNALVNAAWLRMEQRIALATQPVYKINPITTVDNLVKRLLDIKTQYHWISLNLVLTIHNVDFEIIPIGNDLTLKVTNLGAAGLITNNLHVYLNGDNQQPLTQVAGNMISVGDTLNWTIGQIAQIQNVIVTYGEHKIFYQA
jgi:hypothetical protein